MTTYIIFGQDHIQLIDGKVFDKDCVAMVVSKTPEEGRKKAFKYFDRQFCFEYFNCCPPLEYFPAGCIWVANEAIVGLLDIGKG